MMRLILLSALALVACSSSAKGTATSSGGGSSAGASGGASSGNGSSASGGASSGASSGTGSSSGLGDGASSGASSGSSSGAGARLTRLLYNGKPAPVGSDPYYSYLFADKTLGATCVFQPVNDIDMRCVPSQGGYVYDVNYSDSNCQHPIIQVSSDNCDTAADYYFAPGDTTEPVLSNYYNGVGEVMARGAATTAPSALYTRYSGGGCQDLSYLLDSGAAFYSASAVDVSTFAHASFSDVKGTHQLLSRPRITTDEGLIVEDYFQGSARDLTLDVSCYFNQEVATDCRPSAISVFDFSTDAGTCTTDLLGGFPSVKARKVAHYKTVTTWQRARSNLCKDTQRSGRMPAPMMACGMSTRLVRKSLRRPRPRPKSAAIEFRNPFSVRTGSLGSRSTGTSKTIRLATISSRATG